jgi:hypothetical protein
MATDKEIKQIAKAAAQQAVTQVRELDDAADGAPLPTSQAGRALDLFDDIFTDIGDLRMQKSQMTKYAIYRNGELLTTRAHPCSWEKLQKEMGGGHYRIVAKDEQGAILKQQSKAVADPLPERSNDRVDFEFGESPARPSGSGPSFMEMFTMLRETETKAKQEARESASENSHSSNTMLSTFLTLMQQQQAQSQAMVLELSKSSQAIAEKLSENQNRMFEKLSERIERVQEAARAEKKSDGPNQFDVMKMVQDAEDRGFKRFQTLHELAEEKAEEKMELLESLKSDEKEGGKKSLIDSVIEATLPTIANALSQQQQPQPGQSPALPAPPRRVLRPAPRPVQPGTGAPPASRQAGSSQARARGQVPGGSARLPGRPNPSPQVGNLGLPQTTPQEIVELTDQPEGRLARVLDLVVPILAGSLTANEPPEGGALKTQEAIEGAGLHLKETLSIFTREVMMDFVKEYPLPEGAKPWFEAYYENLRQLAGYEQATKNKQPEAGGEQSVHL